VPAVPWPGASQSRRRKCGKDYRHAAACRQARPRQLLAFALAARRSELVALDMANIDEAPATVTPAANPYHLRRNPAAHLQQSDCLDLDGRVRPGHPFSAARQRTGRLTQVANADVAPHLSAFRAARR
jgi:hypothetical protein